MNKLWTSKLCVIINDAYKLKAQWADNSYLVYMTGRKIINFTRMETFTKKPKLAKLLRELKSTPVSYNEKVLYLFLTYLCFAAG